MSSAPDVSRIRRRDFPGRAIASAIPTMPTDRRLLSRVVRAPIFWALCYRSWRSSSTRWGAAKTATTLTWAMLR